MNKKIMKIITFLAIIFMAISTLAVTAFASDGSEFENFSNMSTTAFDGYGDNTGASKSVGKISGAILNIVRVVAVAAAVIMLIVLAIKYISSAPNDKAEIKKHAVVYVVGAILLFSASGVLGIIQNFASNIQSEGTKGTTGNTTNL